MKKLSIEEKAKRYDEALKVLHKYDGANIMFSQSLKEEMFPELTESEDDKLKEQVVYAINQLHVCECTKNKLLAWLEKQGNLMGSLQEANKKIDELVEENYYLKEDQKGKLILTPEEYERVLKLAKKQGEQKPSNNIKEEWVPQCGDTIRKKGTTEPLYVLCKKEGCEFSFVEERENGISGGYLSDYALKDYELVERPKTIEEAVDELFKPLIEAANKQKPAWSEEDKKMSRFIGNAITVDDASIYLEGKGIQVIDAHIWLEELKERVQPRQEWNEEDDQYLLVCKNALAKYQVSDKLDATIISRWLENKLKSIRPQNNIYDKGFNNEFSVSKFNQWKPSDEQMKALYEETQKSDRIRDDRIVSLYNDLKKLKED